jgi:hypothetical protein
MWTFADKNVLLVQLWTRMTLWWTIVHSCGLSGQERPPCGQEWLFVDKNDLLEDNCGHERTHNEQLWTETAK